MKDKFRVYTVTDTAWKEEAWDTAVKRRGYHAKLGSKRHWSDPEKGEYTDEYYGSLGHIVWREKIKQIGLGPVAKFAPLYTDDLSTLPLWDSEIMGVAMEQKSVPPDSGGKKRIRLLIKESEYKGLPYYTATKFWNDNEYSFCGWVTKRDIDKAVAEGNVKNFGFEPAIWFYLDQLKPIEFTIYGTKIIL